MNRLDKPASKAYTEPMSNHFLILPLDQKPNVFDLGRTYPTEKHAIQMLVWQGYSDTPQHSDYWGHDNRIISQAEYDRETNPADLTEIKEKVREVTGKALGPHLDTPIYDQLAREYDKKYNAFDYFESAVAKKLHLLGAHRG